MGARLFYLVGASGAGKDSLLRYVREHLPSTSPVVCAHRYITRSARAGGENHVELTEQEFETRLRHGCFAMHWQSHGLRYGIGEEIRTWMKAGLSVIMNGSRAYLETASSHFEQLVPVLVQVRPEVLRQRLFMRSRESAEEIASRLKRAETEAIIGHPALVRIDNNDELELAGQQLLRLVVGEAV